MESNLMGWPDQETTQQGHNTKELFDRFYSQWAAELKRSRHFRDIGPDDVEDILSETWKRAWKGSPRFKYMGDQKAQNWLRRILKSAVADYWRKKARSKEVSLQKITGRDGIVRWQGRSLLVDLGNNAADWEHREVAIALGKQCLNEKQLELLVRRLRGAPLHPEWSRSWIDTTWHRLCKILVAFARQKMFEELIH